jgi:hypothetical protein
MIRGYLRVNSIEKGHSRDLWVPELTLEVQESGIYNRGGGLPSNLEATSRSLSRWRGSTLSAVISV